MSLKKEKDSFTPLFCKREFYLRHQNIFYLTDSHLNKLNLSTHSRIIIWIIVLTCLRRPQDWFGGFKTHFAHGDSSLKNYENLNLHDLFLKVGIKWPQKINPLISLTDFITQIKIKPLPDVAHRALYGIHTKKYPTHILDYEPSPLELLKIQCEGYRIITFESDYTKWPDKLYGARDPLSFWLHDCIHAEHFFADNENLISQIGFYKLIYFILEQKLIDPKAFVSDFESAFNYLISDMNSHPLHLIKTLKALIDIHLKPNSEAIWDNIINSTIVATHYKEAMRNVNTSYFAAEHCDLVLQFTKRLGAQG
ncbi:MAG: hypothetical protein ACK41T_09285 [Pseudobdellovibrio sp.]